MAARRGSPASVRLALSLTLSLVASMLPIGRGAAQSQTDPATRATARQLGEQGIEAFWAEDYAKADDNLARAYRLFPVPTLGLWSARARVRLGHLVEAAERYREASLASGAVGDSAAQKQAQQDATQELNELSARIPSLTIQLENASPSEVTIAIDGVEVPSEIVGASRPTNPGAHRIAVVYGGQRDEIEVSLEERQHEVRSFRVRKVAAQPTPAAAATAVRLAPSLAVAPKPSAVGLPQRERALGAGGPRQSSAWPRAVAVVALSLGGANLVASGSTALAAWLTLSKHCKHERCDSAAEKSKYDTLQMTSTATFYLGAALATGGLLTWFLAPKTAKGDSLSWSVGPRGALVRGKF